MKTKLVLLLLCLLPSIVWSQPALTPGASPAYSWRIRQINFIRNPSATIFITLYNFTDTTGTQTLTVSYPCVPGDCATDTEPEVQTLMDTWFSADYTGTAMEEAILTQAVADFDVLAGMTCCD